MKALVDQVLGSPAWVVYLVVAAVVLAEDAIFVGFVVPGETLAIIGGVTASLGHTNLAAMLAVVAVAAVVGDSIGYEVGRVWGTRVLDNRRLDSRREQVERTRGLLRRRGGVAVFLGRWSAFLRAVVPALSGAVRMPYRTFLPWNVAGGVTWTAAVVVGGYLAGASYGRVEQWLGRGAALVIAGIVVLALVGWHLRRRLGRRHASSGDAASRANESGPEVDGGAGVPRHGGSQR